jgi:hypothetical protein
MFCARRFLRFPLGLFHTKNVYANIRYHDCL